MRWGRLARVVLVAGPIHLSAAASADPARDYVIHCQGCHLVDGSATPGRVPALAGSVGRLARVPEGRAYLAGVPGAANAPLSDAALAALLNWLLLHFDPAGTPPGFAPYTGEEVARLRRPPLTDVVAARQRVLEALARSEAGAAGPGAVE